MKRSGLPPSLCVPLEFLVERRLPDDAPGTIDRIEPRRTELANRPGVAAVFRGPGSDRRRTPTRADEAIPEVRSLFEVAHSISVSALWGMFLHLCARSSGARTILELGTAAGISGCYLGSAPACQRLITVEGSPDRSRLADDNLRHILGARAELITASFDDALTALLPRLEQGIDLFFLDGDKTRGHYLALLDRVAPRLNTGALVVFDDIQWSEMGDDWRRLCEWEGLSVAVNAGRFGVCVWEGGTVRPKTFTLYALGGVDLYQARRNLRGRRGV